MDASVDRTKLFVFVSDQNGGLFALTRDPSGANLPWAYGPWQGSTDQTLGDVAKERTLDSIELRGYYLSRSDGFAW